MEGEATPLKSDASVKVIGTNRKDETGEMARVPPLKYRV